MSKIYHALPTLPLANDCRCIIPTEIPLLLHLEDPANFALIHNQTIRANIIAPHAGLDQALNIMQSNQTPLLLVVDEMQIVRGIISSEDILGEKPLQLSQEKDLKRATITVEAIMTPHNQLQAIEIEHLRYSKVGHIIFTLRELNQAYLLVISLDAVSKKQIVCGMFSTSSINKLLGTEALEIAPEMHSIVELQRLFNTKLNI